MKVVSFLRGAYYGHPEMYKYVRMENGPELTKGGSKDRERNEQEELQYLVSLQHNQTGTIYNIIHLLHGTDAICCRESTC